MEITKNSPEAGTCNKVFDNFYEGINVQIKDAFFFTFIIQFILVSLMYYYYGNGRYWKVLLYASIVGLIGAIIENSTIAYICQKSQIDNDTIVIPFFINEIFWITSEYAIPYLNLIKLDALSREGKIKYIKLIIFLLFIPFSGIRIYNGYDRMMKGYLNTHLSKICHGIGFGIMGLADIICSVSIICYIKKLSDDGRIKSKSFKNHIKYSSYTILVVVDIASLILSILYILNTIIPDNSTFESSTMLFHCLKSVFILILTTNALIFRFELKNRNNSELSMDYSKIMNSNSFSVSIDIGSAFSHDYNSSSVGNNHRGTLDRASNSTNRSYSFSKPIPEVDITNRSHSFNRSYTGKSSNSFSINKSFRHN